MVDCLKEGIAMKLYTYGEDYLKAIRILKKDKQENWRRTYPDSLP